MCIRDMGGISNGEDIYFRVAFKPVATLLREQQTVDIAGNAVSVKARGRHDPCVLPRAVPIVEAMTSMEVIQLTSELHFSDDNFTFAVFTDDVEIVAYA